MTAGDEIELWGTVNPQGALAPADNVCCCCTVQYSFDSDAESIEFYTDLNNPVWQFTTVMDGVVQAMPKRFGRYETICGFELYYPRVYQTLINIKLSGTVPSVAATGNYSILSVTHYDAAGESLSSADMKSVFLNPDELGGVQGSMEIKLSNLRHEIDRLFAKGVDTSSAEEKYSEAYNAVSAAEYSSPSVQSSLLSSADLLIQESKAVLDDSWALHSIETAEQKIGSVDLMVEYFESEKGMSDDSRVWVVKSYNDNAKTLLVLAKDKYSSSDNEMTREYAGQAEAKADEAYGYAASLNNELNLGAPVQTEIWNTPTPAAASTVQAPSETSSINNALNFGDTENMDDIDTLLHSDVDVESFLKIAGKTADLLMAAIDFLNSLIASASDN